MLDPTQKIASAISALPQSAASATSATIGEREGKIRNVDRLEQALEEERKIKGEAEEQAKVDKLEKQRQVAAKKVAAAAAAAAATKEDVSSSAATKAPAVEGIITPAVVAETFISIKKATMLPVEADMVDKAPVLMDKAPEMEMASAAELLEESPKKAAIAEQEPVSTSSLTDLKKAIESLGKSNREQETLDELKQELVDYDEDVRELDEVKNLVERVDLHESRAAKRLFASVNKMLNKADLLVETLKKKEKELHRELQRTEAASEEQAEHEEGIVTIQELIEAVTKLQKTPNQAKVDQIAQVL
jgi:LETM1 and EF-hand domain-containing protein 1